MNSAVIVACARTALGRSHKNLGVFRDVRSDDLASAVVRALIERTGIDVAEIEDVLFGVTGQRQEQGYNLARMIGLLSGLPVETAGTTINRLCGSSLQALSQAAHAVAAGAEDVQVVGGVEHMQRVPMETSEFVNPRVFDRAPAESLVMGNTAETLARERGISRREQDEFAWQSHMKAAAANARGEFKREIVPVATHKHSGERTTVDVDQCVRPDTSLEQLGSLSPAFQREGGTVTAGNSSPLNDGAAALLMMSEKTARRLGLKPLVRVVATAVAGVDPRYMGAGPIPAAKKALSRAGLTVDQLDLVELNEAFAVQAIVCRRELGIPDEKLNVRGGAIALGHPLGASGARIAVTLIHALCDRQARYGMAAMCIGVGQGIAIVFERCDG